MEAATPVLSRPPGSARSRDLTILALLGALLFFPALGGRDLWNPDEARYAEVAREMRATGTVEGFFVPHLNGDIYAQKPPLLFWLMALGQEIWPGKPETASRFPSAFAAVAAVLAVYLLGERLFSRRAGWLAAAVLATCAKVLWQGRFGQIDMLLTALVAWGVWFWVRGFTERRPGFSLLFFALAGLATLAKGPVGLLPPLFGILAFLLWQKRGGEIRHLHLGVGLAIWAGVVLLWLAPAGFLGGEPYLREIVFKQNVTRYAEPWHHFQPWYYYLTVLPADFFPWSLLLPGAIVIGWKRFQDARREGFRFALAWAVATLVFFSLSPAKRSVYILTLYPALALLIGAALDEIAASWPALRRHLTWPLGILAGLAALVVIALPIAGRGRPEVIPLGGERLLWEVSAALALLLAAALYALWQARAGRVERAAAAVAAGMSALGLTAALVLLPRFDIVKSARPLSHELLARLRPGEVYGTYPRLDSTFLFYTRKFTVELAGEEALRRFAARPERVWILAERDSWRKISAPPVLVQVAEDQDVKEGYLLLTNRPEVRR